MIGTSSDRRASRGGGRGWRVGRSGDPRAPGPRSSPSTAASATSSAEIHMNRGRGRLRLGGVEARSDGELGLDRAGHSTVTVTPVPRSSPRRAWL